MRLNPNETAYPDDLPPGYEDDGPQPPVACSVVVWTIATRTPMFCPLRPGHPGAHHFRPFPGGDR